MLSNRVWRFEPWEALRELLSRFTARRKFSTERSASSQLSFDGPVAASAAAAPPALLGAQPLPDPDGIAPACLELRFTQLQKERRFDEMWPLLAEDAQRTWGSRTAFVREMRAQAERLEVLEATVESVEMVSEWTDLARKRTYRNVARLAMRYRVKHKEEQLSMCKEVHLVTAADGWRTFRYGPCK